MIGVTQLLSTGQIASTAPDGSASDPFTDFAQIAASGLADGRYYLNDGTRTREYYMSIDGTAAGQSTGGWARIDSTSMGSNYSGQECYSGTGTIDSNGLMKVRAVSNGGLGSSVHGGCGVGYNNTYFKARKICFSDVNGTGSSYNYSFFYFYFSPTTLRSDWYGNQSGNGGYHYPGAYAFPTNGEALVSHMSNYTSYSYPNSNVTSLAQSVQFAHNGNNHSRIGTGYIYDFFTTQDMIFHLGQSSYPGTNSQFSCKMWFKF